MNIIEDQVVSLDMAKRLKELGVMQVSLFAWAEYPHIMQQQEDGTSKCIETTTEIRGTSYWRKDEINAWSAYTVAELGDMLPICVTDVNGHGSLFIAKGTRGGNSWVVGYSNYQCQITQYIVEKNLVEAFGRLLIYLIERKLIEIQK